MDVVVIITQYRNLLQTQGYAPSTVDGYRKGLDLFRRWLEGQALVDLRNVTHRHILDYQAFVMAESISIESKALKIRPVKRLFEYLTRNNQLLINPTEGIIETNRRHRKTGTVITQAEAKKLLDQPNMSLKTGIRDRAILEVLYATGIRLGELLGLEVHHADLKDMVLVIRKGKGNKDRIVPLGKQACKHLREYLEKVRPWHARKKPKERRLFLNHSGEPMTSASVRQLVRVCRIAAGIRTCVSPHTLRRSCATHLLQQGADIRYIQKLLGHNSLNTTQTYTKVMPVEVKKTHETTHPGKEL